MCGWWPLSRWPGPLCVVRSVKRGWSVPCVAGGPCVADGPCLLDTARVWVARSVCGWLGPCVAGGPCVARGPCVVGGLCVADGP